MKTTLLILFAFISQLAFAQNYLFSGESKEWKPEDFKKAGIKKIAAYAFKVKPNGKVKRDSTLLYTQEYDVKENKVAGVKTSHIYHSQGPIISSLEKFERNYNSGGNIIRDFTTPLKVAQKKYKGLTTYKFVDDERLSEYDENGNTLKKTYISSGKEFTLDKKKDTIGSDISYTPQVYDYVYRNNKIIEQYNFNDSTKTTITMMDISYRQEKTYSSCYSCRKRYKFLEHKYNADGLLRLSTSFTEEGLIHSKTYFYYNDKFEVVKEIDSTGWYISSAKPYAKSETTYQYIPGKKIKTEITFETKLNGFSEIVTVSNTKGYIINECRSFKENVEECENYEYKYEGNVLKCIINTDSIGHRITTLFEYNSQGLIASETKTFDGRTVNLTHYNYE